MKDAVEINVAICPLICSDAWDEASYISTPYRLAMSKVFNVKN